MKTTPVPTPVIDRTSPKELVPQETCEANALLETRTLINADCLVEPQKYLKQVQVATGGE
jgi:hypothetical protein